MSKCIYMQTFCPENSDPEKGDYCPYWWDDLELVKGKETGSPVRYQKAMCSIQAQKYFLADLCLNTAVNVDVTEAARKDIQTQTRGLAKAFTILADEKAGVVPRLKVAFRRLLPHG